MHRQRTLAVCALCLIPFSVARAQVQLSPAFENPNENDKEAAKELPFAMSPQPSPDPKLRHRLWPAPEDRVERPIMVAVNRSMLLVAQVPAAKKRAFLESYERWASLPIDELPVAEAKASCQPFQTAIRVLRDGQDWMSTEYDLGLREMSAQDKVATLLPEYQEMRDVARLLCIRARVSAAEERWDDAIDDLRLGFRLSEIASHGTDTLLGRMIGIAIAEVMMETVDAMIRLPECPNMYWALAAIPVDHLFEIREAIEYETTLLTHIGSIAGLPKLSDQIIGADAASRQLKAIVDSYGSDFQNLFSNTPTSWLRELSTGALVAISIRPSRELLAESQQWSSRVSQLSDAEAVLRACDLELTRAREDWLAWSSIPLNYRHNGVSHRQSSLRNLANSRTLGGRVARVVLPDIDRAAVVGQSATQSHHRLVTLEAIRLHAAEFGELPDSLENLQPAPAWHDPQTGRPFAYRRTSPTTAELSKSEFAGITNRHLVTPIRLEESK